MGFSLARGNSETTNLALAINAVHPTLSDKITIYSPTPPSTPTMNWHSDTVANLITAEIRYDHNLNPK